MRHILLEKQYRGDFIFLYWNGGVSLLLKVFVWGELKSQLGVGYISTDVRGVCQQFHIFICAEGNIPFGYPQRAAVVFLFYVFDDSAGSGVPCVAPLQKRRWEAVWAMDGAGENWLCQPFFLLSYILSCPRSCIG